jgi:hypothetical protein
LKPGVMSSDRLEGVMRLTPALGQQKIYVLVFTTPQDLQQTTKLIDPAKAYAKGTGNAVPDIPDPIAKHVTDGTLAEGENLYRLQRAGWPAVWLVRSGPGDRRQYRCAGCRAGPGSGGEKRTDA